MSEHRYDIRISESCVDPNPLMFERQGPDNFTRFQMRERGALEIAAYVFKPPSGFGCCPFLGGGSVVVDSMLIVTPIVGFCNGKKQSVNAPDKHR